MYLTNESINFDNPQVEESMPTTSTRSWATFISSIIYQITKEYFLVDDTILYRLYLLKWYAHLGHDKILANQSAKMAIELEKASTDTQKGEVTDINA